MIYTNNKIKQILKAELVKRGISVSELVFLLNKEGINETKSGVTSKLSRGSFSAVFFLQCLSVIGCRKIEIEDYEASFNIAADLIVDYKTDDNG